MGLDVETMTQETLRPESDGTYTEYPNAYPTGTGADNLPSDSENVGSWETVGSAPYLPSIDSDVIQSKTQGQQTGDITFQNSVPAGKIIDEVYFEFYTKRESGGGAPQKFNVYWWNGASWEYVGIIAAPNDYEWRGIDMTAILTTWAKIDDVKVYLIRDSAIKYVLIDAARIRVEYHYGTTHYDKVDEETPDDNATYVRTDEDANLHRDSFNLPSTGIVDETINWVRVYNRAICYKIGVTQAESQTMLRTNSADYYGAWNYPTSYTTYYTEYANNPNTGNLWTPAEINALEVGVRGKSTWDASIEAWLTTRCTQVYEVTDYSVAVEVGGILAQIM